MQRMQPTVTDLIFHYSSLFYFNPSAIAKIPGVTLVAAEVLMLSGKVCTSPVAKPEVLPEG